VRDDLRKPQPVKNGVESTCAPLPLGRELKNAAVTLNNVPTTCRRCGLPLSYDQNEENERARRADISNTKTVLIMFLIPLAGLVTAFFSISKLQLTSSLFSQSVFYLFLTGVFLTACPFLILAMKGTRLFKKIEGTSYYCPSCLKKIREDQRERVNDGSLSAILVSGQSKHYENDAKQSHKGTVFLIVGILVPGLIFGWLYGAYVKEFSFQANLEATLFSMALFAGTIAFVLSRFITPKSVDITPDTVVVVMKRGRRKIIPFGRITWLNVAMDVRQLKDISNAIGTIDVGRRGIFQMTYRIKREIALDIREAYKACLGDYLPNGYDTEPEPQERR
jgi:FtsH-binding integral membrane protein